MRFGIEFGSYPSDLPPVEVCRQVAERAIVAQKNNFEALFVARIREGYERRYLRYQQWGHPGERYDLKFDELQRDRLILGSPAEVVEQVMSYYEEFQTDVMWFMVDWPGMDPRFTLETIECFGAEVIPQVNRLTRPCPLP